MTSSHVSSWSSGPEEPTAHSLSPWQQCLILRCRKKIKQSYQRWCTSIRNVMYEECFETYHDFIASCHGAWNLLISQCNLINACSPAKEGRQVELQTKMKASNHWHLVPCRFHDVASVYSATALQVLRLFPLLCKSRFEFTREWHRGDCRLAVKCGSRRSTSHCPTYPLLGAIGSSCCCFGREKAWHGVLLVRWQLFRLVAAPPGLVAAPPGLEATPRLVCQGRLVGMDGPKVGTQLLWSQYFMLVAKPLKLVGLGTPAGAMPVPLPTSTAGGPRWWQWQRSVQQWPM